MPTVSSPRGHHARPVPFRVAPTLLLATLVAGLGFAPVATSRAQAVAERAGASSTASGQAATVGARRALTLADYAGWRRVSGTSLSDDGRWLAWSYIPNDGDAELHVRPTSGGDGFMVPSATAPVFNDDASWVAYYLNPTQAEMERARRARSGGDGASPRGGSAPTRKLQARSLTGEAVFTVDNVQSFAFANGGAWLAARVNKPNGQKHEGTDLVVRDLRRGSVRNIGNVSDYAFDEAGTRLAYTIDAADQLGNGVHLLVLATGETRTLESAAETFAQLSWSEDGAHLAVLRGSTPKGRAERVNALRAWRNVGTPQEQRVAFDAANDSTFAATSVLSEYAPLRFSPDGARLLLGTKAQDTVIERGDAPRANVDVWHWKDADPQAMQIVRLAQERRRTETAVFDLAAGTLRVLTDSAMRSVTPTADLRWGIGRIDLPYRGEVAWGGGRADYVRVDLRTGARTPIATGLTRTMGTSPDSRWFLYLGEGRVHAYELATARDIVIDASTETRFVDVDDDHDYERPTYGVAGWSADGRAVVLNHRYDLWQLALDGSRATNLTRGVGERDSIQFRIARADGPRGRRGARGAGADDDDPLDLSRPLLLSAYGDWTKQSGYYTLAPGKAPAPLLYADKQIAGYTKAKNADRVLFTQGSFTEYPDWWLTDTRFSAPRRVTSANPQLADFAWGSKVLVEYTTASGRRLQGTLTLPANYEPGRRYPMLVYFYEKMSQTHHAFSMPVYDDRPHISTYASNGYLVLQPDVVYDIGRPGTSALDCVTSAVQRVIELGYADPDAIGLQGHSWGGYQSSFILTQTNLFKAVVTGAPPTDLVSFYGTLYRSSGSIQQGITEVGQVRMGRNVTPWTHEADFERESPMHHVANISTPFVILHGTEDGAVDWMQGLELYAAARRMGKQVVLLSYPGEPHHLAKKENQLDFQVRMRQFFDHHLKGEPAATWMTDGVPQLRKGRETDVPVPVPTMRP